MADFVDMLSSPKSFSNPAQDAITKANTVYDSVISNLTALKTAADTVTTAPVPPATTPAAITISNLGLLALDANKNTLTTQKTQLATFKTHTDALSNVNPGDTEPSYNHALSASSTIQNAAELKAQIEDKGASVATEFDDVFVVADMDMDSIMGSITASNISNIVAKVTELETQLASMTEYSSLLAAINARNKSESERIINLYAPKLTVLMTHVSELNTLTNGTRTTDIANYNKVKAVSAKLSEVAMMFAGMSDPMMGKLMGNISK